MINLIVKLKFLAIVRGEFEGLAEMPDPQTVNKGSAKTWSFCICDHFSNSVFEYWVKTVRLRYISKIQEIFWKSICELVEKCGRIKPIKYPI